MAYIMMRTNKTNEAMISRLLMVHEIDNKIFKEEKEVIFVLELYGYQVDMVVQMMNRFLKDSRRRYENIEINVYICNEILFSYQNV